MPDHALVDARSLPAYDLGQDHPFARFRQEPLFDLMDRHGWLVENELFAPGQATDEQLQLAHETSYIEFVKRSSEAPDDRDVRRSAPVFGLGTSDNPIAPGQHDGGSAAAAGTLECVRRVVQGNHKRAFNSCGGLHHAMPSSASGFCIYNDLVVGIREAQRLGVERVVYIDYDVHHGDGVEFAFKDDPNVMTVSFHESPDVRWPFTGRATDCGEGDAKGTIVNMPFQSFTGDASWQHCVEETLRKALAAFRPQLIVTQHGADPHWEDPLAELRLTCDSFRFAAELSRELADEHCDGKWVATGGGGYQPVRVLPRAWAIVWAVMSGRTVPDLVDDGWIEKWQSHSSDPLTKSFLCEPIEFPGANAAARTNEGVLRELMEVHSWG